MASTSTNQQLDLDETAAVIDAAAEMGTGIDVTTSRRLLDEVRRLRAEVAKLDRALRMQPREVLRGAADLADPEAPEVSFFGGMVGPSVAAWLRMIGDHPETVERLAAPAAVETGE